jgi:hypothetical protein
MNKNNPNGSEREKEKEEEKSISENNYINNNYNTINIISENNLITHDIIHYINEYNENTQIKKTKLFIKISYIGISLIDQDPRELAYIYLENPILTLSISNRNIFKINFSLNNLQIDNSLINKNYPVIFKTSKINFNSAEKQKIFFELKTEFSYNKIGKAMYIDNFEISIKNKIQFFADAETFMEYFKFIKNIYIVLQKENSDFNKNNNKYNYEKLKEKNFDFNFTSEKNKKNNYNDKINDDDNMNDNNYNYYDNIDINFNIKEEKEKIEKENLQLIKMNLDILDDLDLDFFNTNVNLNYCNNNNKINKINSDSLYLLNLICDKTNKKDIDNNINFERNLKGNEKMKILLNRLFISQVNIEITIKPSKNIISNISNPFR